MVGLPRCDYVFASARSCFIAYGFGTSDLEVSILRDLLEKKGIEPLEAGGMRAPGTNAFCVKICSKIITSQFCAVLLNDDLRNGVESQNPNVNMEYGLMLGFNKYVIPFQRKEHTLPFNVSALDTIKYTNQDFHELASVAIDQAVAATTPADTPTTDPNQRLMAFLLSKERTVARIETDGDKAVFDLGNPLGFNLLISFSGIDYTFLGNFSFLRPEAVVWRLRMLSRAIDGRRSSWDTRIAAGIMTAEQATLFDRIISGFTIWVVVNTDRDRDSVNEALAGSPLPYNTSVYSLTDIDRELSTLTGVLS